MDIKEILKESVKDGVNQFFDSVLNQLEEENKKLTEEELTKHQTVLEEVNEMLETIDEGKGLKGKEYIWIQAMVTAIVLSGCDIEDTEFEDWKEFFEDSSLKDFSVQWEETKMFLDTMIPIFVDKNIGFSLTSNISLEDACNIFFEEIKELQEFKRGLFSTRKLKKEIRQCSGRMSAVCTGYILGIEMIRKLLLDKEN